MKIKIQLTKKVWGAVRTLLEGKFIELIAYIKKKET